MSEGVTVDRGARLNAVLTNETGGMTTVTLRVGRHCRPNSNYVRQCGGRARKCAGPGCPGPRAQLTIYPERTDGALIIFQRRVARHTAHACSLTVVPTEDGTTGGSYQCYEYTDDNDGVGLRILERGTFVLTDAPR